MHPYKCFLYYSWFCRPWTQKALYKKRKYLRRQKKWKETTILSKFKVTNLSWTLKVIHIHLILENGFLLLFSTIIFQGPTGVVTNSFTIHSYVRYFRSVKPCCSIRIFYNEFYLHVNVKVDNFLYFA